MHPLGSELGLFCHGYPYLCFYCLRSYQALRGALSQLNKQHYLDITARVAEAKQLPETIQAALLCGELSGDLLERERLLLQQYNALCLAEESFFKQKARIDWLSLGDNTAGFFYQMVKVKQAKYTVKCLVAADRRQVEAHSDTVQQAVHCYSRLIVSVDAGVSGNSPHQLQDILRFRITEEH